GRQARDRRATKGARSQVQDAATGRDRQAAAEPGGDGGDAGARGQVHAGRHVVVRAVITAPGEDAAVGGHRQAKVIAGGDGGDVGARGQVDGDREGTARGGVVPQLPEAVAAPGEDAAVGGHRQAKVIAGGDGGDFRPQGQVDGNRERTVRG